MGKNEKTKVVLKITKSCTGPPAKEPVLTEEDRKLMMLHAYRRQEELKVSALLLQPRNFCRRNDYRYRFPLFELRHLR